MNDFTNRLGNPSDEQLKKESFSSIGKKMRSTAATIGQNKEFLPQSNEQNNSIFGTTSGLERSGSSDQNINPQTSFVPIKKDLIKEFNLVSKYKEN